jgi:YHS domain-containing protein
MKRFLAMFCAVLITAVAVNVNAGPKLDGVKCPVSGKKVLADKTVDYKGGKVFFCCPGCPGAFTKGTAKFAAKANHQLVQTGQFTQAKCPLAGRAINPDKVSDVAGVKVGVCCGGCLAKLAAKEDKVTFVFNDATFAKGFVKAKAKKKS